MDFSSAILLGVVQGLTEFLPVSSSGHLVLVQKFIPGFSQSGVVFDVVLHLGTLFAVFVYFWKRIFKIRLSYLILLAVGTIPAVLVGVFFRKFLEDSFATTGVILGIQFIVTSFFCFLTDKTKSTKSQVSTFDAFLIGVFQALAILPAISRSGATIFAGVKKGINKEKVAEFSFILSIPAILGANVLELYHYKDKLINSTNYYLIGFLSAAFFGYLSIFWTMKFLRERKFKIFGIYTFILGLVVAFL